MVLVLLSMTIIALLPFNSRYNPVIHIQFCYSSLLLPRLEPGTRTRLQSRAFTSIMIVVT